MSLPAITSPHAQVIACTRLSTGKQEFAYGRSVQVADLQAFTNRHGLNVAGYIHEVQSGADAIADRDVVQDYYRLAREHPGLGFVFPRVDRLGRLAELIITIARELITRKARVYVVGFDRPLDPKSPDWLMFQFQALTAEQNYVGLITNLKAGQLRKAAEGRWPHGKPPWGYRLARDERGRAILPEPIPERIPIIRRVFELSREYGKNAVADIMRKEGHEAPTPAGWTSGTVQNILNNQRYQGFAMFGPHVITFPGIVTPEEYAETRRAVQDRTHARVKSRADHLLTGLARCPECGAAMTWLGVLSWQGKKHGTGERYGYYRCWQAAYGLSKGAKGCPNRKYHRDTSIEEEAWRQFMDTMTTPAHLARFYTPVAPDKPNHAPRIEQLKEQMAQAFTRALEANIPADVLERSLKPMRSELARLEAEQDAPAPAPPDVDFHAIAAEWFELLHLATPEERRALMVAAQARFTLLDEGPRLDSVSLPQA